MRVIFDSTKEKKSRKKRISWIWGCLCLLLTAFFLPATVLAEDGASRGEVLKVAFPESAGLNEINPDGTFGGITYEFLLEIAKYTGWEYEFVTGDAGDLLNGVLEGEYDLSGGMFYREGFEEMFNYPEYIMGNNNGLLVYRDDHPTIKSFDLTTLDGMTIGIWQSAADRLYRLNNFLGFHGLDCEIKIYESQEDYINCLKNNEVDLQMGSDANLVEGVSVAAQFEASPYYLVTSKKRLDLCEQLNEAIKQIYAANPNFAKELQEKYYFTEFTSPIAFSEEDKKFIEESEPIRVAVTDNRYPIFYHSEGEPRGITVDLCNLISSRSGLSFTFVIADTYQGVIDMVKKGEADLAGYYLEDIYAAEKAGMALVKSHGSLDSVILKNKSVNYPSDNLTMAVPEGRAGEETGENVAIIHCGNYDECVEAVNNGTADFTRIPSAFLEKIYVRNIYPNTIIIATDNLGTDLSLAMAKPVNVELYSILSKVVNNFSEQEKHDLVANNLVSAGEISLSLKSIIYSNPLAFIVTVLSFFILAFIVIIIMVNYKMKNKVMAVRIEKAEETAKTKADFLSRMSHEIRTPMNAIIGLTGLTKMSCSLPEDARQNLEKIDTSAQFLLSLVNDVLDMSKIERNKMEIERTAFNLNELIKQEENIFSLQAEQKGLELTVTKEYDTPYYIGDEIRLKQVLTNLLSNACKFTKSGGKVEFLVKQIDKDEEGVALYFSVKDSGIGIKQEDADRIFDSFEQVGYGKRNSQGTGLGLPISKNLVGLMGGELEVSSSVGKGSEFFFTLRLAPAEEIPAVDKEIADITLEGMKVLLAEDNALNAEIAAAILELKGAVVERVEDGQQAVELFLSRPENWFDIILMDIQMPIKDGWDATEEIRKSGRSDAQAVPIVAMTANTFREDREHAARVGMSGFVPKPFNIEQLYQTLALYRS